MKQVICDMCEEPILPTEPSITVGEWDFHDRDECRGEFESHAQAARERSKDRRAQAKRPPKPDPQAR